MGAPNVVLHPSTMAEQTQCPISSFNPKTPVIKPLTAPNLAFHMNFKCEDAYLREEAKLESLANRVN